MKTALDDVVALLVARFRRQRPLRGGSLIVTIFGDAIAPRGGAIALGSLIRLCEPFGLAARLVRTSVGRLTAEDWLVGTRQGRLAEYSLSVAGRSRFAEATRRIYTEASPDWDGRWTLAVVPGARGAHGRAVRQTLQWAGFGEPMPGFFMHAYRSPAATQALLLEQHGIARPATLDDAIFLRGEISAAGHGMHASLDIDNRRLVRAGWHLGELTAAYARFLRLFAGALKSPRRATFVQPRNAFLLRTLLIHEYRRVLLRDPLLPRQLLPADWSGHAAYELCRTVYQRVFEPSEAYLSESSACASGPLPPPDNAIFSRFGGIRPASADR
jgi:phenylacetic acid degradation operon negative regulatory protein